MDNHKKKILILVDWFAPGYKAGGPIQSCVNLAFALKNVYTINVLTTDTDHGEETPYQNIISNNWNHNVDPNINTFYARKATLNLSQLKKTIIDVNADYVYLNHLFSPYFVVYPLWLKFTGKLKSKLIVCPRGALFKSALAVKPFKKILFLFLLRLSGIKNKIVFHATNEREKKAIEHYFSGSKIIVADNLGKSDQPSYKTYKKTCGVLRCIFIARIVAIKNLLFLLNILGEISAEITLTIVGPVEEVGYWEKCKNKIKELPLNITVDFIGPKNNNELTSLIQQHHLFILPTAGENFGHSIFEALLAGRPVLISDQTPWLKLNDKKAGWDIPLDRPEEFRNVIEKAAKWDQDEFDKSSYDAWKYAHTFISNSANTLPYLQLFS